MTLRCLEKASPLFAQGAELVLVDDGSRDGTAEAVAARWPRAVVLVNAEAGGFGAAANRGLREARGDVLLLLNSDTEMDASEVPLVLRAFADDARLGAAGAELRNTDGTPQWSAGAEPSRSWLFVLATGLPGLLARLPGYRRLRPAGAAQRGRVDWVSGAAVAIRRAAWSEVGPFDESYGFYGQDLDFCVRLRAAGWGVRVVPGWRVTHLGGGTISAREGAARGRHPGLLWTDLLRWAEKRHGAEWARTAARAMSVGAALRLAGRAALRPFVPRSRRAAFAAETEAHRRARGSLAPWARRSGHDGGDGVGYPSAGSGGRR